MKERVDLGGVRLSVAMSAVAAAVAAITVSSDVFQDVKTLSMDRPSVTRMLGPR